jgi:hypothetical protein
MTLVAVQQKKLSWIGLSAIVASLKDDQYVFVTIIVDVAAGDCSNHGLCRCEIFEVTATDGREGCVAPFKGWSFADAGAVGLWNRIVRACNHSAEQEARKAHPCPHSPCFDRHMAILPLSRWQECRHRGRFPEQVLH